jgi:hypothetical protein
MTLAPPEVRAAKATLAAHRKATRKARPQPIVPERDGRQRQPRIRDNGFLAFLRRLPCASGPEGCFGPVQAAHIRFGRPGQGNAGMQRKPDDRNAVPLCAGHHTEGPDAQHRAGERQWWAARGIDPHKLSDALWDAYWNSSDSLSVASRTILEYKGNSNG